MIEARDASRFAALALGCVTREFPHKVDHVALERETRSPRELHPAFYGCFDWHSAVHGHWTLVRLWKQFPRDDVHAVLDAQLTLDNVAAEAAYFTPARAWFERPYGWAWALALATEVQRTPWAAALEPLAEVIVERFLQFLPKQTYPVRTGVHANTAFALGLALDHARALGRGELDQLIVDRALAYYGSDVAYPAAWEPSGEDFLSPALVEADLMRRVIPNFAPWLHAFLPDGLPASLANPAVVSDRSDPKLAHLDGLNLSRAWCLHAIAAALPANERAPYATAADSHAVAGLAHVTSGDYAGEHWLATFATYLLTAS